MGVGSRLRPSGVVGARSPAETCIWVIRSLDSPLADCIVGIGGPSPFYWFGEFKEGFLKKPEEALRHAFED